ncbi:uncharacterized protein [Hemitrygon akajei]|uniref:uncharacterized protein n=1 Tax=Hemitrygon akajei TaxID=2704970 RepID=UPI003BF94772
MDDSETYINVQLVKPESRSSSRNRQTSTDKKLNIGKDESEDPPIASGPGELRVTAQTGRQTSTYKKLNIGKDDSEDPPIASGPGELRVTAQTDDLTSTYSELNFRRDEPRIDEDEDPPIASRTRKMPTTAQTAVPVQQSNVKIGNRPHRLICLLCLVTVALIVTVVTLSIHVSQILQSKITTDRNYHELNSSLQSKLSALNSNLSNLKRMHSDLRHQFTEMETKYRSVNETKAHICEFLTSRREQTCSENWVTNNGRCYYVSTFVTSFCKAIQDCSNRDSRLLEINSTDEENFVSRNLVNQTRIYWIGKCENGNVSLALLYNVSPGPSVCIYCESYVRGSPCDRDRRFICEKSAPLLPDIPEKIQGLCQQPVEST